MLKDKLVGRTIVDYKENHHGFDLMLDNGEKIEVSVSLDGGPDADAGWYYQWGVLRVNDHIVARV